MNLIIDTEKLTRLIKAFYTLTKIRVAVFDASFNKQNNTVVIKSSAGTLVLYKKESTYFYKGVWKNITISVNAILDFYNNVSRVYYTEKQGNKEIVTIYK